jgi:cyclophilin family peptidyl-prolyl cis-trans isomerase
VIQGGGYTWDMPQNLINAVPKLAPVANEFNIARPNIRGAISMAKLGGETNSATSEWFINLADNPDLNTQNGGFAVFGQVKASSMAVVDAIAALPRVDVGSPFDSLRWPARRPAAWCRNPMWSSAAWRTFLALPGPVVERRRIRLGHDADATRQHHLRRHLHLRRHRHPGLVCHDQLPGDRRQPLHRGHV